MNGAVFDLPLLDKFRIQGDQIRGGNGDQGLVFLESTSERRVLRIIRY